MNEKQSAVRKYRPVIIAGVLAVLAVLSAVLHFTGTDLPKLLKNAYYLSYLPSLGPNTGYGILLLFGLFASIHCVGMCGGLILTQTVRGDDQAEGGTSGKKAGLPLLSAGFYNIGRILSYTLVGALVGGLGQVLTLVGFLKGLIPILGGVFMLLMAINLLGIFPVLRRLTLPLPKSLAKWLYRGAGKGNPFLLGLLTGLMPCGPMQIVQVYALSTKSVAVGALSMLVFALGTTPALFAFGALGGLLSKRFSHAVTKASAVVVACMGVIMIGRGLALTGVLMPEIAQRTDSGFAVAAVEGNMQRVETSIDSGSYPPIQVRAGIPVEWTIHADEEHYNDCNNAIEIPAYGLKADLKIGKTLVKFTPEQEGEFVYTCWMGMIKSRIRVTAADGSFKETLSSAPEEANTAGTVVSTEADAPENTPSLPAETQVPPERASQAPPDSAGTPRKSAESDAASRRQADPTPREAEKEPVTLTGYLIDEDCFVSPGYKDPAKETRACLTMPSCAASGYGLAVPQSDGTYRFYYFDGAISTVSAADERVDDADGGQRLAWEFINESIEKQASPVTVTGRLTGETRTNPDPETADGIYYEILQVVSIEKK